MAHGSRRDQEQSRFCENASDTHWLLYGARREGYSGGARAMTHVCVVGWVGEWWTLFRNGLRLLLNGLLVACHVSVGPIDGAALRSLNTWFSQDENRVEVTTADFTISLCCKKM